MSKNSRLSESPPTVTERIPLLDSLRGVAILLVICAHTSQKVDLSRLGVQMTQLGVQLFFLISAVSLCLSLQRRSKEPNPYGSYLIRRFFRIAPPYYIAILGYFTLALLQGSDQLAYFTADRVLANVFLVHGFYPAGINNVVPGGWSIGTEFAFYVIFPIVFQLTEYFRSRWQTPGVIAILSAISLVSLSVLIGISAISGIGVTNNTFLYYNLLNQLPVFLLGIFLFHVLRSGRVEKLKSSAIMLAGLCICGIMVFYWKKKFLFSFVLIPSLAGGAFFFLALLWSRVNGLNFSFLRKAGKLSYSMYLIHFVFSWPIAGFLYPYLSSWLPREELKFAVLYIGAVSATYFFAFFSEKFIEGPGIRLGNHLVTRLQQKYS